MDHVIGYDLARGLHIISVIAWVAALLMLPRFYAYICSAEVGGELERAMLKAARSLQRIILTPSMILAWSLGLFLFGSFIVGDWSRPIGAILAGVPLWFWIKLALVLGLSGYHGFLAAQGRKFVAGQRPYSEKFWRLMSEVPFLVAIAVILLATIEP